MPNITFLLGRFIDAPTLVRASALAAEWGVQPHDVLISNGWIAEEDYYRALADHCRVPFKAALCPQDNDGTRANERASMSDERHSKGAEPPARFVLTPDTRLRPNDLRVMLARSYPLFPGGAANGAHEAIYRHFASGFASEAVHGLATRHPEQSARAVRPDDSALL